MSIVSLVGFAALISVIVLTAVVSFRAPSPARDRLEWVAATSALVALCMLFVSLFRGADGIVGSLLFGFLVVVFGASSFVALKRTLGLADSQ
ncbi:MAG: hypothetical protein HYV63_28225 [Candidatus Schekmanbacteria bacterium]|nr:hypothetical protein [Candidatus Schekmanbacteria bacterium]